MNFTLYAQSKVGWIICGVSVSAKSVRVPRSVAQPAGSLSPTRTSSAPVDRRIGHLRHGREADLERSGRGNDHTAREESARNIDR
jgi:hypothetical protein